MDLKKCSYLSPYKSLKESDFSTTQTNRGKIRIHSLHRTNERAINTKIASYFTNRFGQEIDLLPNSSTNNSADVYNRTLRKEQEYKCNTTGTANTFDMALRSAAKQANSVVIWIEKEPLWTGLSRILNSRIKRTNIEEITIVFRNQSKVFPRSKIVSDGFKIQQTDLC